MKTLGETGLLPLYGGGMKWKHDALADDLAAHLRGMSDRVVWTDMQLGPAASPRPDVYTMPKSFARFTPLAYEIKISTSDFRRDITSGKWQSYLKYASGVIFAVPAGLIKREDVPAGCGLITRGDGGWHTVKGPTLRAIDSLPLDAWIKLMIDGIQRQPGRAPNSPYVDSFKVCQQVAKKYGAEVAALLRDRDGAAIRLKFAIESSSKSADSIAKEAAGQLSRARDRAEQDIKESLALREELARAFGLPEGSPMYSISVAASEAIKRLTGSGEYDRIRAALERAEAAILRAREALPLVGSPPPLPAAPAPVGADAGDFL